VTLHPAFRVAGHLIRRAFQAHDAVFARETAGFDVTSPQVATLTAIALWPGIELTPLADRVGYDAATLSGLINRLIGKRLVRRAVGKHDRRTRQLFLTAKGQDLLDEVTPYAARVTDVLLAPLSPAERGVFFDMMERIVIHAAATTEIADTEVA
jgi:DNA-binding MarR family transcriptional regulator